MLERVPYLIGFLISFISHLLIVVIVVIVLEARAASAIRAPEVFSVTLEGGEMLGGLSQVPKEEQKTPKVLPNVPTAEETPQVEATKKIEIDKPTVVDEVKKKEEENKKKAEEQKKAEEKKKEEQKKLSEKQKKEEEAKKAAEAKKKEADEKKQKELEKGERERRIRQAVERAKGREYTGESANAGGEGFGAAQRGGKGMGGGTLASPEFIAYMNALEEHIKAGWRWGLPTEERLQAQVLVVILPNGVVQDARVSRSSGNAKFDESALRAVFKASPVPPPPQTLYDKFREVRITFDPSVR